MLTCPRYGRMHLVNAGEPLHRGRYQGQTGIQLPKELKQ